MTDIAELKDEIHKRLDKINATIDEMYPHVLRDVQSKDLTQDYHDRYNLLLGWRNGFWEVLEIIEG
jgi:hypothetical protein